MGQLREVLERQGAVVQVAGKGKSLRNGQAQISRVAENRKAHSTFDLQLFGWQPHHMNIFPRPSSLLLDLPPTQIRNNTFLMHSFRYGIHFSSSKQVPMLILNLIVRQETPETRRAPSHVTYLERRYPRIDDALALFAARPSAPRWHLSNLCMSIQLVKLL